MYIVKVYFEDLQDRNHPYRVGDIYPREGLEPSPERIKELSGADNLRGTALITAVKSAPQKPAAKKAAPKKAAEKSSKK